MIKPPENKNMFLEVCEDEMPFDSAHARRVPLALIAALLLQAGTAIWWAASSNSDLHFTEERLARVEHDTAETKDVENRMLERLARIDERVNSIAVTLDYIAFDARKLPPDTNHNTGRDLAHGRNR